MKKRSRLTNRPFYLLHPKTGLDSIFIIWQINDLFIPFQQLIPRGPWKALNDLKDQTARHAFNNVCIEFESKFAVQMKPEGIEISEVRNAAWKKFRTEFIDEGFLDIIHQTLEMLEYSSNANGIWLPRLEIAMMYAFNFKKFQFYLVRQWEKAYSVWYPCREKRHYYEDRKRRNGFHVKSGSWDDLKMVGRLRRELYEEADRLRKARRKIGNRKRMFNKGMFLRPISGWRLCVAALYLKNPLVCQKGDITFLLKIWEDNFYGVTR